MSRHSPDLSVRSANPAHALAFHALDAARACLRWLATALLPATLMISPAQADIYTQVSAGGYHTCAIYGSGGVQCWGSNIQGQLGDRTFVNRALPTPVFGLTNVTAVAAGGFHTCALTAGQVKCWGANSSGQLGPGSIAGNLDSPIQVLGLTTSQSQVVAISAGFDFSCALISSTRTPDYWVRCWGANNVGQMGSGAVGGPQPAPAIVTGLANLSGLTNIVALSSGSAHSCVVFAAGNLKCWGNNSRGQLGNGTTGNVSATPTAVANLVTARSVSAGFEHTCAVDSANRGWCWGDGRDGEIGNSTANTAAYSVPTLSIGETSIGAPLFLMSAGTNFTCSKLATVLFCWGRGDLGQVGRSNAVAVNPTPAAVDVLVATDVTQVSTGAAHACALLLNGRVACWGYNATGQLGNNTVISARSPTSIAPPLCSLDVDGDGNISATTDMVILTRAALGIYGPALVANATSPSGTRRTATDITDYLASSCGMLFP